MSIQSLTEDVTVTIKRKAQTAGAAGGKGVENYTVAARGSLVTSITARASTKKASELEGYGVRGDKLVWKFLFSTEPSLTTADLLEITDNSGVVRQMRCLHRSEDLDMRNELFRVHCEDLSGDD